MLPLSVLAAGDRRFEAQTYLSSGFGLRLAIESKGTGWVPLATMVKNTQPPRLKGIHVGETFGRPYLSATQVFDLRPVPRKFLSLGRVKQADLLSVSLGDILVTRSGTVGRVTLAHIMHIGSIVSDDLIRVIPKDGKYYGWVYAFLRSPTARQMMTSAHYGHVISRGEASDTGTPDLGNPYG
jgi:type I restriction enzyme S subunit